VAKLTEYAWLMGREDIVKAMEEAGYTNYGAPKVKAFADLLGLPWPDKIDMHRMAQGKACNPDNPGCGCDEWTISPEGNL
jgi:hypothetical protein